jgi:hypothetical protein
MQSLWKLLACPLIILTLAVTSLACRLTDYPTQTTQATPTQVVLGPTPSIKPRIILQRLQVAFLGQDGHRLIGSGCPGNDGGGTILDYHFIVNGVDTDRHVQRVSVAGDNSTLTGNGLAVTIGDFWQKKQALANGASSLRLRYPQKCIP